MLKLLSTTLDSQRLSSLNLVFALTLIQALAPATNNSPTLKYNDSDTSTTSIYHHLDWLRRVVMTDYQPVFKLAFHLVKRLGNLLLLPLDILLQGILQRGGKIRIIIDK